MIPIQGYVISPDDWKAYNAALDKAIAEAQQATTGRLEAEGLVAGLQGQIKVLQAQLAPKPASPKITRTVLPRLAGMTIENGQDAPSQAGYDRVRKAMQWGQRMGLNACRFFLNAAEVRAHVAGTGTLGNLPAYARECGLRFLADTIDAIAPKMTNDELRLYMDGLAALDCEGVYINDANRIDLNVLKTLVKRIRDAAPTMPIFASLTASANLETYKALVDYVEIQTFGTLPEFTTFAKKDAILCLDLRQQMTAKDLKARLDILAKTPRSFFLYADKAEDYEAAPDDEDALVKGYVSAWKG